MAGSFVITGVFLSITWILVESLNGQKSFGGVKRTRYLRTLEINQTDSCFADVEGKVLNLKPLQRSDGMPRYSADYKKRTYTFNPCLPFSLHENDTFGDGCDEAALCINQTTASKHYYYTAGLHDGAVIHGATHVDTNETFLEIVYNGVRSLRRKISYVRLKCDHNRTGVNDGLFVVKEDINERMTAELHHSCCCLDGCPPPQDSSSIVGANLGLVFIASLLGVLWKQ